LLDWSRSAYVAAFFAFRAPNGDRVSVKSCSKSREHARNSPNGYHHTCSIKACLLARCNAGEHASALRWITISDGPPESDRAKSDPDWQTRGRRVLAEFRADSSRHLEDPGLQALVADLRRRSRPFRQYWTEHAPVERTAVCANSTICGAKDSSLACLRSTCPGWQPI